MKKRLLAIISVAVLALSACGSNQDPLNSSSGSASTSEEVIVVGSQDYYSNEIIAEIYAQALEAEGFKIQRDFRIGAREVYLPEIEAGKIDLFPEYTGNLLQYWDSQTQAKTTAEVYEELQKATPEGLIVLEMSEATDQDSYSVTKEFADKYQLESIADLANVSEEITVGANSELVERPYGPKGLAEVYGVEVNFTPIEDSGGPLTVNALLDGSIQVANIYSASPAIASSNLVVLADPEGIFLSSNVVPLASDKLPAKAQEVINKISNSLGADDLVELNNRSVNEQLSAEQIAKDWLAAQ